MVGLAFVTSACVTGGTSESEEGSGLTDEATTALDEIDEEDIAETAEVDENVEAEQADAVDPNADESDDLDDQANGSDSDSSEPVTEEVETTTTTSTTVEEPEETTTTTVEEPEETTTTTVEEDPLPVGLNEWAGTYTWTEFVESETGSNQTLTHQFTLVAGDATVMNGTYTASGFQTSVESTVEARLNEGGDLTIFHQELISGLQAIEPGSLLVIFQGEPSNPITVLGEINNLDQTIRAQGTYFQRA